MEFYPEDAPVPDEVRSARVLLRPLRATDVERDYDAVMSSAEQLRGWSQTAWPSDDFTLAQNLDDLRRHAREHLERKAFTFTVLDPDGSRCLGCVYITPVQGETHAAAVGFWVRSSELASNLDKHLLATLRDWLGREWRFERVVFSISPKDHRQALILAEAGLRKRSEVTLADGRTCWVFG